MTQIKTNTENAILNAAEELFLENGYHIASTTMIAKKAGVTHAMLHYYFRTKEQIFLKVVEKNLNEMLAEILPEMTSGHSFWEIIKAVTTKHFDFLVRHRRSPNLILEITQDFPEIVKEYKERIFSNISNEIARHSDRFSIESQKGHINKIDPIQFLFTAITLNMTPFLSIPFLKNVMEFDDDKVNDFLEQRKQENLRILHSLLFETSSRYFLMK